jgi:hypothetical protein
VVIAKFAIITNWFLHRIAGECVVKAHSPFLSIQDILSPTNQNRLITAMLLIGLNEFFYYIGNADGGGILEMEGAIGVYA